MADLATQADVEASLLRALTTPEATYVSALLARASRQVRVYLGQYIEEVADDVVTISADMYGTLRLPQRPVTAIASIVVAGTTLDPDTYEFTADGVVTGVWADGFETNIGFGWTTPATFVYTHGYDPIPDDIVGVVADAVAARITAAASTGSGGGAVKLAQVDDVRIEYDTTTTSSSESSAGLSDEQKRILDPYKSFGRPIDMVARRAL